MKNIVIYIILTMSISCSAQSIDNVLKERALANMMLTCMHAEEQGEDVSYVKSVLNIAMEYMTLEAVEMAANDPTVLAVHRRYKDIEVEEKTPGEVFEKWKNN